MMIIDLIFAELSDPFFPKIYYFSNNQKLAKQQEFILVINSKNLMESAQNQQFVMAILVLTSDVIAPTRIPTLHSLGSDPNLGLQLQLP